MADTKITRIYSRCIRFIVVKQPLQTTSKPRTTVTVEAVTIAVMIIRAITVVKTIIIFGGHKKKHSTLYCPPV